MCVAIALAPAEVPASTAPAVVRPVDRVGQAGPRDDRGEPELVAAGEEHRGGIAQAGGPVGVLGLGSLLGPQHR